MTKKIEKPTKKEILAELKKSFSLDLKLEELTDEVYEKVIKGYDSGLGLRTMASRVRFHLTVEDRSAGKEKVAVEGYFVGSRDLVTPKKPLGKNKVQLLSFLKKGTDGHLRLFTEPANPTHFKGFKKDVFGKPITADMVISEGDKGHFATPGNIAVIENAVGVDPEKIEVMSVEEVYELEDYTNCAVVAKISSIWPLRIPAWEAEKWDEEDYPLFVNKNPVFQLYMTIEEDDGPVLRGNLHPTHISKPYIQIEDFEYIFCDGADIEDEINPSVAGRKVILIGQKRSNSEYNDKSYVDFDINGIIEITGTPLVTEAPKKSGKPQTKPAKEDSDAVKTKVRQAKVAETVTALREHATVDTVKTMHDEKFFKGVSDEAIQKMVTTELVAQEITPAEEDNSKDDLWV